MVVFYWPVALLLVLLWRKLPRFGGGEAELARAAEFISVIRTDRAC